MCGLVFDEVSSMQNRNYYNGFADRSYVYSNTQMAPISAGELERMKAIWMDMLNNRSEELITQLVQASATMQMQRIEIARLLEEKQNLKAENERLQEELRKKTLAQKPVAPKKTVPLPVYKIKVEQVTNAEVSRLALQERLVQLNKYDPNKATEKFREINRKWLTNYDKWAVRKTRSTISNIQGCVAPWCLPEFREELIAIEKLIDQKRKDLTMDN